MFEKLQPNMRVSANVTRIRKHGINLNHRGVFRGQLYRKGKLIFETFGKNDITTAGKNKLLDDVFGGGTPEDPWYIGLVDYASFSSFLAADTLASHTGWTELIPGTAYTGDRLEWVDGAAAAGSKTSSSDTTFPILQTKDVYGILLASVATGTAGILMATGAFDAVISVVNTDSLKVSYTISY